MCDFSLFKECFKAFHLSSLITGHSPGLQTELADSLIVHCEAGGDLAWLSVAGSSAPSPSSTMTADAPTRS